MFVAPQSGPCHGQIWSGFGEDDMSSQNPCNKAQTFGYPHIPGSDDYELRLEGNKVGRCFAMREQKECRYAIGARLFTAFYNCKTPVCNSWDTSV
jgi:hypothetical protein